MVNITGFATSALEGLNNHIASLHTSEAIIFEMATILIISAIFAFVAKILKQPLIPAYVLAGLLLGPLALGAVRNIELIKAFSEIGIAFLLFIAGLEISFKKIKEANLKKISVIGTFQIVLIFLLAVFLANFLRLTTMQAVYVGIVLAFGSTMVVVKLLADKGELITMHGRLVLGILLLQDLFAIIAIVLLMSGGFALIPISLAIGKLIAILVTSILLQKFVLNKLFRFAAQSTELLLLSSLAVLFLFIILASIAGVSIVIGAFIAGVSLANSPFKLELESRISPLRDFFSILFFFALGVQIVFSGITERLDLLVFILVVALIVKPALTTLLLRIGGYRPRTSFEAGISLAQLSEFSLIIGVLGLEMGVLDQPMLSSIILATIISMSLTSYFIEYKSPLYSFSRYPMKLLKFLPVKENLTYVDSEEKTILLVGAHRMGSIILEELIKKDKKKVLVLDYNPEVISALTKKKISCIYGDLASPELFSLFDVTKLKTVISTVPNAGHSLILLNKIKAKNKTAKIILTAPRISEAEELYEAGADYVILPKIVAGEDIIPLLNKTDRELKEKREVHRKKLKLSHRILY